MCIYSIKRTEKRRGEQQERPLEMKPIVFHTRSFSSASSPSPFVLYTTHNIQDTYYKIALSLPLHTLYFLPVYLYLLLFTWMFFPLPSFLPLYFTFIVHFLVCLFLSFLFLYLPREFEGRFVVVCPLYIVHMREKILKPSMKMGMGMSMSILHTIQREIASLITNTMSAIMLLGL